MVCRHRHSNPRPFDRNLSAPQCGQHLALLHYLTYLYGARITVHTRRLPILVLIGSNPTRDATGPRLVRARCAQNAASLSCLWLEIW